MATLDEPVRRRVEEFMGSGIELYPSWLLDKIKADLEARFRAEGEARGEARSLLAFCAARGLALTDAQRERILGCTEIATLDRWIQRAASASDAAAIFD